MLKKAPSITRLLLASLLLLTPLAARAQTRVNPPRNLLGVGADLELGRETARQVESESRLLYDAEASAYVNRVGRALVAALPEQYRRREFVYTFRLLDDDEPNAKALAGGTVYVNRGLIELARDEGELAGVLSHEISHVALRHVTAQVSKGMLAQVGITLLSGLGDSNKAQAAQLGAHAGLSLYLLKYKRDYETQADILGAQIMARAGYDPSGMVSFFRRLEGEGGQQTLRWLSSHPDLRSRAARVTEEAAMLTTAPRWNFGTSELSRIQARLRGARGARPGRQSAFTWRVWGN
jgi:beta-barrel assembly-enhancing protease